MRIPLLSDILDVIHENSEKYGDSRMKYRFMLFDTPVPVWILTALYLAFVWAGPKYMKNRQAYSLRTFMVIYNIGLVFMSIYMFVEILLSTTAAGYQWMCSPYNEKTKNDPRELRVVNVLWWYGLSKAIELMDTVLMILRKKQSQVTFLHVFHHATMLNIWWWVPTFIPGGQTWFGACLNCAVHVVMYLYYGLAVIPQLRDKLWWKRYITTFQLVQFIITFTHTVQTFYIDCDFPMWGIYLLSYYMVIMLILFGNFYIQSYIKTRKSRDVHPKKESAKNGFTETSLNDTNGNQNHISNGHSNGVTKRHYYS